MPIYRVDVKVTVLGDTPAELCGSVDVEGLLRSELITAAAESIAPSLVELFESHYGKTT